MITFSTLANDRFQALRASVLAHPRMHGYYIIDLVSIEHLRAIGYTGSPALAEDFVTTFIDLFDAERTCYARLGLGNREYVFLQGIVVTDPHKAGILWVVEGD